MVSGDINCWDMLWGGHQLASYPQQGGERAIIKFLSELNLQLLLPQNIITYSRNLQRGSSIIDLVMTTSRLFSKQIVCCTHETEHGFNHLAIFTQF